jgi:hypothetical protein
MDFSISGPQNAQPGSLVYVMISGATDELEQLRDALDRSITGPNQAIDAMAGNGIRLRIIIDRRGMPRAAN